jgi:hypothetical protein
MKMTLCYWCKHQHPPADDKPRLTCAAFPDGVTLPIPMAEVGHNEPYPGDRGIRFERQDGLDDHDDDSGNDAE